jgi:hypothetical protein
MNNYAKSTFLDKMNDNVLDIKFNNFTPATINHAKNQIIDSIGCLICGVKDAGNPGFLITQRSEVHGLALTLTLPRK